MRSVAKKVIRDEADNPVAVQVAYQDWLEIEEILGLAGIPEPRAVDLTRFAGAIKLTEDPLDFQKRIRDEWP